ncbi:Major Facilitator Superfamily protein [Aphelenchoides besseyi]|nr:Major Facilitator Superfamily protein [Aphelenchoides besseyi]
MNFRFLILGLTTFCLTSICSNMIAFNVTMLCDGPATPQRDTISIWAVSIGSILATLPFNLLYARYGARYVFATAGTISFLSTALIPVAHTIGFVPFVALRFLQGVAFASNFAGIGMVTSRWACLDENGFFMAAMTIFSQISVILTNPLAGALCNSLGWHSVYYVHAMVGPLLFGLWFFLYNDYPEKHRFVSEGERKKIMDGKNVESRRLDGFVPYKQICTNKIILIVWFNAFGDIISAIFLLTYFPQYLTDVLGYPLEKATILSMFPAISHIPSKLAFGWIFDKTKFMSEINKMRICNTIALFGSALFFILVGFVPRDFPALAVTFMTINYACIGANCGGFYKCGSLVSRQFTHFVIANVQFLKCVSFFISPLMVLLFVHDSNERDDWRIIFFIMAAFLIVGNFLFCYFVSDQPAEFTKLSKNVKVY